MESLLALILYQNMLFGEGLESILIKNDFSVTKLPFPRENTSIKTPVKKIRVLIIELDWPFPALDYFFDNNEMIQKDDLKIILIPNVFNKTVVQLIHREKIDGVILKSSDSNEFIFAVKQVIEGKKYYSSMFANIFLHKDPTSDELTITKREKQILSLLAELKTTAEIAEQLSISQSTVKTHRRNLLQKFNAKNIFCLLRAACRYNLLNTESEFCGCCHRHMIGTGYFL